MMLIIAKERYLWPAQLASSLSLSWPICLPMNAPLKNKLFASGQVKYIYRFLYLLVLMCFESQPSIPISFFNHEDNSSAFNLCFFSTRQKSHY